MPLVAVVFGWPAVIASVLITFVGILASRWRLALVGTAVGVPFLVYLFLSPRFTFIAPLVGLSQFAAVYALARGYQGVAIILVIPFVTLAAFVASLVLRQFAG